LKKENWKVETSHEDERSRARKSFRRSTLAEHKVMLTRREWRHREDTREKHRNLGRYFIDLAVV
jgi:hypothetical protein